MGGRFGKYGDIKRKDKLRKSERLKQEISTQKITGVHKKRLRKKQGSISVRKCRNPN